MTDKMTKNKIVSAISTAKAHLFKANLILMDLQRYEGNLDGWWGSLKGVAEVSRAHAGLLSNAAKEIAELSDDQD